MTIACTITGQPATIEIPDDVLNRGALKPNEAAKYLSISLTTLWILLAAGKIARTEYGSFPISSLQAHLSREIERASK